MVDMFMFITFHLNYRQSKSDSKTKQRIEKGLGFRVISTNQSLQLDIVGEEHVVQQGNGKDDFNHLLAPTCLHDHLQHPRIWFQPTFTYPNPTPLAPTYFSISREIRRLLTLC
jgi:hypothetical protein